MAERNEWPPAVRMTLDQMRAHFGRDPESLLEQAGAAPYTGDQDHCFIDLIGHDDELVDTIRVDRYLPIWRTPLGLPRRAILVEPDWPPSPTLLMAEWRPTDWTACSFVSVEFAPGWSYDLATLQVRLWLKRYRRVLDLS